MPFIQNVNPPKNKRVEFAISNFSGGLNNRLNTIDDNQASDILNMKFLYDDVMEKRNGYVRYDDLLLDEPITFMDLYRPYADEDVVIRATDSEVYFGDEKVADISGEIDGVNYQGTYLFADGNALYTYGRHTETTSAYVKIIGTHPKDYALLKVVNPPEGYEPLDKVHVRGVTVYNYDEGTVHYEPCENELDDVYLGANLLPKHPRFIQSHKGRLFVSGDKSDDDNVFMTNVNSPFYFAVSLPIQLPPNSDSVRGMAVWDDAVIIGRRDDMYRIVGSTANPELGFELFELKRINSHTGIANNKCLTHVHSFLFFLGSDGVGYAISTTRMDERLLATQIISQTIDVFKNPISASREDVYNASAVFDGDEWYVNLGERTLVYSYRVRAWTLYDSVDMRAPMMNLGELIWGRSDGTVAKFSEEYWDYDKPILAFWESKAFDMGHPSRYKQFREFYLVAHAYDYMDTDIRVTFEIDYADVKSAEVIENMISIWGISEFGDRFADRNIKSSIPVMIGRRARFLRFKVSNGYRTVDFDVDRVEDLQSVQRKFYYMTVYVKETDSYYYYKRGVWTELDEQQVNQPMLVYQINGEYEMKGKR